MERRAREETEGSRIVRCVLHRPSKAMVGFAANGRLRGGGRTDVDRRRRLTRRSNCTGEGGLLTPGGRSGVTDTFRSAHSFRGSLFTW